MPDRKKERPFCFADLESVFPMGEDGLRQSPESCMVCHCKTECLKEAVGGRSGDPVKEEMIDRAYASGQVGFWERWSRRKALQRRKKERT
jgi:hypothetical protein